MLTCCGFTCGNGCNGGYLSGAWNFFKSTGLVTGGLYGDNQWCAPYFFAPCDHHVDGKYGPCGASQPTPKCVKTCASASGRTYANDKIFASSVYSISGE